MIKNYCIKVISSVFIMLTVFMVSTSVFATELSEQYSNLYTLGGSITAQGIPLHNSTVVTNGSLTIDFRTYNKVYLSNNGVYYCIYFKPNDITKNPYLEISPHFWLKSDSTTYFFQYSSYSNSWGNYLSSGNSFMISYTDYKKAYIYSETTTDIYNASGTLIYDWEEVYEESFGKKIIYEVNYSEGNKTAILSAEIKNGAEGDKLYYSTLGYSITGKLMNPIELNQSQATAITLNKNILIHLQALDSER